MEKAKNNRFTSYFKFILMIILCVLLIFVCSCYRQYEENKPCNQYGQTWVSEDGNITMHTDAETGKMYGVICVDGQEIPLSFGMEGSSIGAFYVDENGNRTGTLIEDWFGDFSEPDKFTVTVDKSQFFEVGQTITFYRIS